jgi:very-short-patch-repair endonuclease
LLRLLRRLLAICRNKRHSWNQTAVVGRRYGMVDAPQPFLGQEAVARGELTAWELRTHYRSVYRNVYVAKSAVLTAAERARAAWLWCGGEATVIGRSAAALHGTKWIDADSAAELCRLDRRHPRGIKVRTYALSSDDECWIDDIRVTTPERTAFDIGRLHLPGKSVPVLDALVRATDVKIADVAALADDRRGVKGRRRLHAALELVDGGAESPQESRLRLMLVRGRLPKPETQICFYDDHGNVRIRIDMGWPEWKVGVEYDGEQHWSDARQRAWDIERLVIAESEKWSIVRVSAALMARPQTVVDRVATKLRQAGWSG